jgi:hypothetical protein
MDDHWLCPDFSESSHVIQSKGGSMSVTIHMSEADRLTAVVELRLAIRRHLAARKGETKTFRAYCRAEVRSLCRVLRAMKEAK